MKILLLCFSLFSFSSWAHELALGNYLKMQDALANDNFKLALENHNVICDKELTHYKDSYKECEKSFKDIEQLREAFKTLSSLFIVNGEKKDLKGLILAECPMAKAKWIQKDGKIRNPYYGKSMLDCGGKVFTF
jgi:hypothetical protein